MKKIIYTMVILATLFSCAKDRIPIPTGLLVEETDLTLVAEGETYRNRFYTTAEEATVVIPENDSDWLNAVIDGGYLVITVQRNASIGGRSSTIKVVVPEREATIKIAQTGLPTRKIKITGGTYSSTHATEGKFMNTWDGDYSSYWHTNYSSPTAQYSATHWLQYDLESGAGSLDLIVVWPRTNAGASNGRWGYYCIYVKGDGTDTPGGIDGDEPEGEGWDWCEPLGSVDADGYKLVYKGDDVAKQRAYGGATNIILPTPINHPTNVKVVLKGGPQGATGISYNGHGSLAEIELLGKVG
jgi:hypothetical protein